MKSKPRTTHRAFDEQGRRSQSCWRPCRSRCPLSSWSKSQKRGSKGERRLCMPVTCCLSWGSLLARGDSLRQQIRSSKIFVVVFVVCCFCLRQKEIYSACSYFGKGDIQWYRHVFKWIYPKLDFLLQLEASDFLYDSKLWLTHSKTASKYFAFDIRIFLYQTLKKISWSSILQSLENKAWYFVICYDSIGLSGDMKISFTYCKQLKHDHSKILVKMIISNSTFTYA